MVLVGETRISRGPLNGFDWGRQEFQKDICMVLVGRQEFQEGPCMAVNEGDKNFKEPLHGFD